MAALVITGRIRHALEMLNEIIECVGSITVAQLLDIDEKLWIEMLDEKQAENGYEWEDDEKVAIVRMITQ